MSKVKQILAGVLSASMIVTLMPAVTFADDQTITWTDSQGSTQSATTLDEAIANVWAEGTVTVTNGTIGNVVINKNTGFTLTLNNATLEAGASITVDESIAHPCLVDKGTSWVYHPTHKFTSADGTYATATTGDMHLYCQYGCTGVNVTATMVPSTAANPNPFKEEGGYAYYNATLDAGWAADQYNADMGTKAVVYKQEIGAVTTTYDIGLEDYAKDSNNLATTTPVQFLATIFQTRAGVRTAVQKSDGSGNELVAGTIEEKNDLTVAQITDLQTAAAAGGIPVIIANGAPTAIADRVADANQTGTSSYKVTYTLPAAFGGAAFTVYIVNVIDEAKEDEKTAGVKWFEALYADEDGTELWSQENIAFTVASGDEYGSAAFNFVADTDTGIPFVKDTNGTTYNLVMGTDGSFSYRAVNRSTRLATEAEIAEGKYTELDGQKYAIIYGDVETYVPDTTDAAYKKYDCGTATFPYKNKDCGYDNQRKGKRSAYHLSATTISLTGKATHTADNIKDWAIAYTDNSTHDTAGSGTFTCSKCNNAYTVTFPKKNEHVYVLAPDSINPKVTTVTATCQYPNFQFKECTVYNGTATSGKDGWVEYTPPVGTEPYNYSYTMALTKKASYTFYATVVSSKATIFDAKGNKVAENIELNNASDNQTIKWHPVLVDGSVGKVGDHSLRLTTAAPEWQNVVDTAKFLEEDVICIAEEECENCGTKFSYAFHKFTYDEYKAAYLKTDAGKADPNCKNIPIKLNEGSTDTGKDAAGRVHIFGTVTYTVTPGANCLAGDKFTFTATTNVPGKTLTSSTVTSKEYYGPHSYKNSITWYPTGDSMGADVMQQCTVTGCKNNKDLDGNEKVQTVKAVVTSEENADGSTTYTATLLGITLTDNTKTVINLAKADVVVNGGKDIDLNNYGAAALKDLTEVTINGVTINPDEWAVTVKTPPLATGNNVLVIVPNTKELDPKLKAESIAVNSKEVTVNCVQPPTMEIATASLDGVLTTNSKYDDEIVYDGLEHPFVVTVKDTKTKRAVEDATIEYSAVCLAKIWDDLSGRFVERIFDIDGEDITNIVGTRQYEPKFRSSVALTESGEWHVFVRMSKEGYSTTVAPAASGHDVDNERVVTGFTDSILISPKTTGAVLTVNKQLLTYGEEMIVTTGDEQLDKDINLNYENTGKLNVGTYKFMDLVKWDSRNYDVTPYLIGVGTSEGSKITIEKRNATLILTESSKTYDGKPVDKSTLFKIDGLVNEDQPEVIVSTAGNKDILDVGTYTLVATANDSNYVIEKVTATYTVNPASIAGAKVVLAKTSYTYTGKALKPAVKSVTLKDGTVLAASDYTVTYKNNTNVGTATATVTGKGNYTGTANATFKITAASLKGATVTLAKKSVTYNGKAQKVAVKSVKLKNGTVVPASNYTVTYKNNKNAGKATVTVTGKANYTGTATANFTITKAANTLAVSKATRTSSNNTFTKKGNTKKTRRVSGLKVTNKGQGTITYKKVKVNKNGSKFQVNAKTGKITIYKGTPKGTYQVTVSATAAGNKNYKKSAAKTAVVTIVVK